MTGEQKFLQVIGTNAKKHALLESWFASQTEVPILAKICFDSGPPLSKIAVSPTSLAQAFLERGHSSPHYRYASVYDIMRRTAG